MRELLEAARDLLDPVTIGICPTTGLMTRAAHREWVRRIPPTDRYATVIVIDLDGLKAANDRDGYQAGDALLRSAADTLVAAVRSGDLVVGVREGGDELAVIVYGTVRMEDLMARVRAALDSAEVAASVGAAVMLGAGVEIQACALQRAAERMQADKLVRKGGVR